MMRFRGSFLLAWLAVVPVQAAEQSVRVLLRADIYSQPTGDATVVAVAQGGQLLDVVVREGDWYEVRIPSTTQVGHIYAPLVEPVIVVQAAPSTSVQTSPAGVATQPRIVAQPMAIGQPTLQPAGTVVIIPAGTVSASSATPGASSVLPFSMDSPIPLGPISEEPVTLDTVRFRMNKGQLLAEVHARCTKGHDQEVNVTLELLDDAGTSVATLQTSRGVEEEDDATLKARARLPAQTLALVRSFALQVSTRPD
jgi:hypothetical protein